MKFRGYGVSLEGHPLFVIPRFAGIIGIATSILWWSWNELPAKVLGAPELTVWQCLAGIILITYAKSIFTREKS